MKGGVEREVEGGGREGGGREEGEGGEVEAMVMCR